MKIVGKNILVAVLHSVDNTVQFLHRREDMSILSLLLEFPARLRLVG